MTVSRPLKQDSTNGVEREPENRRRKTSVITIGGARQARVASRQYEANKIIWTQRESPRHGNVIATLHGRHRRWPSRNVRSKWRPHEVRFQGGIVPRVYGNDIITAIHNAFCLVAQLPAQVAVVRRRGQINTAIARRSMSLS